ncbi:MAG: NTP transferase domain-containing protein [Candidatus Aenigmarchaeota archaeon]|nr:NTP transferase domain-containing protein [Candidatus Aenigmarchaeota archaeon]
MKERITLTIDKEILGKLDKMIDGLNIRNRSHAIEMVLSKYMNFRGLNQAIILCGGEGTRLRPITYEIPKPLVPVHGKALLEHIFDLLKKYEIRDVTLSIGHMKQKIKEHVGDGSRYGLKINYVEEDKKLGTAGPLRLAKGSLKSAFIMSNGDELKNINIMDMYDFHKRNNALATIALTTVSDPSQYGVAKLDGNRIVEFVEKPKKNAPSNLINAGFYILEPEVIEMIPSSGFSLIEKDVFPLLARKGRLFGFPFSGQWFDTGNMERYERALKQWKDIEV